MAQNTTRAFFSKGVILFSGVAMICFVNGAEAGFEWKGALVPPAAEGTGVPAAESLNGLEPVIMWDGEVSPSMPAEKVAPVEAAPVASQQEEAAIPAAVTEDAGEVVSGFGADLPLVIALQQVVPAGYQFSFAKEVNPGVNVSWQGGEPWKNILAKMLQEAGLGYRLQNNIVVIGKFSAPEAVAPSVTEEKSVAPVSLATPAPEMPPMPVQGVAQETVAVPSPVVPKAEQIPDDLTAPPSALTGDAPVDIRRQKPSTLLKRMTTWGDQSEETVPAAGVVTVGQAPAPVPATAVPAAVAPEKKEVVAEVKNVPVLPRWQASQGQTLREVLKKWADTEKVELYWSIDYDYRLGGDADYTSSFEDAVAKLLGHYSEVRPQPYGQIHKTAAGDRVLVIKSYDLTR